MRIVMMILNVLTLVSGLGLVSGRAQVHVLETTAFNPDSPSARAEETSQLQAEPAQTRIGSIDQIVDTGAIVYLEIKDVPAQVEALRLPDVLKSFAPLLASDQRLSPEKEAALEIWRSVLTSSLPGTDVALAVWPDETKATSAGEKKGPTLAVGLFMKLASSEQSRQLLQRRAELANALKVLLGDSSGKPLAEIRLAALQDVLVIGEPSVLDRVLGSASPVGKLADDPHYKLARARWSQSPIFLYADLNKVAQIAEARRARTGSPAAGQKLEGVGPLKQVAELRDMIKMEPLPKLAAGIRFQQPHTLIQALLIETRSDTGSVGGMFALLKPAEAGLRAAQWQSSGTGATFTLALDWPALYDALVPPLEKTLFSKSGQGGSPIPLIEALIGYKLRDQLLPALGSLSLSFNSVTPLLAQPSGTPKLTLLVGVRNREVVEGVLKNVGRMISSDAGSTTSEAPSAEMTVTRLGSWAYTFVDGFLALISEPEALQQMIKDHQAARTLAAEPDFIRATQGLPPELVAWGYVSPSTIQHLVEKLRQEAMKNEPLLAGVLALFPTPSQPASLGVWKENAHLVAEARLPEGLLPALLASSIGAKRAEDRDRAIREKAVAAFVNKPDLSSVEVSVKRGAVTLSGTVKSETAKALAQQLVEKLPGVQSVVNDIEVEPKP